MKSIKKRPKLIIIRGPSGVGKTTTALKLSDILKEKTDKLAQLPIDITLSHFIKTYSKTTAIERAEIMQENIESVLKNFLKKKWDVIVEGMFDRKLKNKLSLKSIISIGQKFGAKIYIFELCLSLGEIHRRIEKRSKEIPKMKNIPEETEQRYERFMKTVHEDSIKINVTGKSIEKVATLIAKNIK